MDRVGDLTMLLRLFQRCHQPVQLQLVHHAQDLAHAHAELRQRLNWPGGQMRPRPVHLNTWEGFYFDVYPDKVKELATAAAARAAASASPR